MRIQETEFTRQKRCHSAFTLLEVMIALAIFFICTFAILELMSTVLHNARALQRYEPDAGILAGQLAQTNSLTPGTVSGDFGDLYPGYTWSRDVYDVSSNGLWEADFTIQAKVSGHKDVESAMSVLLFRPQSPETPPGGTLQ
jgi:prepilin-type N-terminal cleavage/methylation domain-containing protein